MTNETTASERERFGRFGHHPDPAIDFCVEVEAIEGEIADRKAGLPATMDLKARADAALSFRVGGDARAVAAKNALRAALPAPADQPPEPRGSSGSLPESGVEARTQDAASASGSLSEIRRTAQVAEAAWWCKNAVRHVRFVSIDATSSIDDRAAAVRAAEEAIDKLAALL